MRKRINSKVKYEAHQIVAITTCAFALVTGSSFAEEKKDDKKKGKIVAGSCCDKAKQKSEDLLPSLLRRSYQGRKSLREMQ